MLATVNDSGYKARLTHSTCLGQAPPPLQRTRFPALVLRHLCSMAYCPRLAGGTIPFMRRYSIICP